MSNDSILDIKIRQDEDEWDRELSKIGRPDLRVRPETPNHYSKGIEPIKFIQSHNMSFAAGNVIKYVCRYQHKGTALEDLNKARHYIDLMLKELEE